MEPNEPNLDDYMSTYNKRNVNNLIYILKQEIEELKKINLELWGMEEGKRKAEKNKNFDENFIQLSRNVYKGNDKRAKIKLKINEILGSNIKEVKSHY